MKAISWVALACALLAAPIRSGAEGDANCDGRLSAADVPALMQRIFRNDDSDCRTTTACPFDFSDDVGPDNFCGFVGWWNVNCGASDLLAGFIGNRDAVILVFVNPDFFIGVAPTGRYSGALLGWWTKTDLSDFAAMDGDAELGNGQWLTVDPIGAPLTIAGCGFELYLGAFAGMIPGAGSAAAQAPAVTFDAADMLERLRAIIEHQRPAP